MRWLLFVCACTPPAGTALETWDGVTAHVWGGYDAAVYARSGTEVGYDPPGVQTATHGYQCTELAIRYMHFNHGVTVDWGGVDAKDMCATHPFAVGRVDTPVPGDLMVMPANDELYGTEEQGHVAIVRAVRDDRVDTFAERNGDETSAFSDDVWWPGAECFLRAGQPASP